MSPRMPESSCNDLSAQSLAILQPSNVSHVDAKRRVRSYDLMRGLAVLGVLGVHTGQAFPSAIALFDYFVAFGRFGIQLFFFVSALTMCYMWEQRAEEKNPVKNFYIRRFFRIAPLFWLAIPVYLALNGFGASYWAPEGISIRQVSLTFLFLHGLWPDSINSVVPGGWSIAIEMTFYLVFPPLVMLVGRRRLLYLIIGFLLWFFNVFFLRDFLLNYLAVHYHTQSATIIKDFIYLNFANQAVVFLLGCYLYFSLSRTGWLDIGLVFAWVLCGIFARDQFLLTVFAIGICVYLCIRLNMRLGLLELLGKNSYAIYLSHFAVLSALVILIPLKTGLLAFFLSLGLTIFISYLISVALFFFVEKRFQRLASSIVGSR